MKIRPFFLLLPLLATFVIGCTTTKRYEYRQLSLEEHFERADKDGDGLVTRKEYGSLLIEDAAGYFDENGDRIVTRKEYYASGGTPEGFQKIDLNGDGQITIEEAKSSDFAMDYMTGAFHAADSDKDGYVTLEEAKVYRKKAQAAVR